MQITVTVPDKQVEAFLKLTQEMGLKAKVTTPKKAKPKEPKLLRELKQSWKEMEMAERGEIKLPLAKDILNEL